MQRILMVGDGGEAQLLSKALEQRHLHLTYRIERVRISRNYIFRHLLYLQLALYAVVHKKDYAAVFIWQQYIGYYYVVISILLLSRTTPTIIYYIISKTKKSAFRRVAYLLLIKPLINSRHVLRAIFLSESDYLYEHCQPGKRLLVPTYVQQSKTFSQDIQNMSDVRYEYDFFSGGTSNRDYSVIKRLADKMPEKTFAVACLPGDVRRIGGFPSNVAVFRDAFGSDFEGLILKSRAVIIPIADPNVNSGQIVALLGMQAGKSIYIGKNNFSGGWFPNPGWNIFLSYFEDVCELELLLGAEDERSLQNKGQASQSYYWSNFSEQALYEKLADIICGSLPVRDQSASDKQSKEYSQTL